MTAYRTILVDTDGSDYSYRVVDHAAELAHVTHARLLIICARHDIDERALGTDVDRLRGTTPTDAILRTAHQHAIAHGAVDIETRILPEPTVRALFHPSRPDRRRPHRHREPPPVTTGPATITSPAELAHKAHCDILIANGEDTYGRRP